MVAAKQEKRDVVLNEQIVPVHAAIARGLHDLNVETVFGLMGDSNLFLVDAFVRQFGGRYVPATHEANAVLMALGHALTTGQVGVATVTQGPAVSNAITPLIDGVKGMVPIVLLCGDTPMVDPDHNQTVAQRALIEATGAGFERLRSPETVSIDLAAAFRRAKIERRPIVFNMPTPMMWETTSYVAPKPIPRDAASAPAEGEAIDDAIGILAAARFPLILAGRGAVSSRESLVQLAERIGAPLATTLKAKGLFQGEPYNLGVFGTLSTPAAAAAISSADCIVACGAGLNRFTTARGGLLEGRRLIQIDDDPRQIGRRAQPDAAIVGNPGLVAQTFIGWLDEAEIPSSRATDTLDVEELKKPLDLPSEKNAPGTIDLSRALIRISEALGPDKLLVTDGGRFLNEAWTRVDVSGPQNILLTTNTGAIGLGVGYAIGAAVGRPDQPTMLVIGDGGLMMGGLAELTTAVREKLNLIVVVCNDSAYGAEYVQFEDRQMDPSLSLFNWPSFAETAKALGGKGVVATSMEELEQGLAMLEDRDGPLLIELKLDPATVPRLHL
ncbi:MAG: thiamine pyrophosphate-binding protein [Rhizobiaceae bacterium]